MIDVRWCVVFGGCGVEGGHGGVVCRCRLGGIGCVRKSGFLVPLVVLRSGARCRSVGLMLAARTSQLHTLPACTQAATCACRHVRPTVSVLGPFFSAFWFVQCVWDSAWHVTLAFKCQCCSVRIAVVLSGGLCELWEPYLPPCLHRHDHTKT